MILENEELGDLDGMIKTMPTKFDRNLDRGSYMYVGFTSTMCKTNGILVKKKSSERKRKRGNDSANDSVIAKRSSQERMFLTNRIKTSPLFSLT